jgi:hypothetical protein
MDSPAEGKRPQRTPTSLIPDNTPQAHRSMEKTIASAALTAQRSSALAAAAALCWSLAALGQGTFQNLDFEQARNVPTTLGPQGWSTMPASQGLPSWTAFEGGQEMTWIFYGPSIQQGVSILSASLGPVVDGNYSVQLTCGAGLGEAFSASISQTGFVPSDARSLRFKGGGPGLQVTLGGRSVSLVPIETPRGPMLAADISAFAGLQEELNFSAHVYQDGSLFGVPNLALDSIEFSPQPIPEPGGWLLLLSGWGFIGYWQKSRKIRRNRVVDVGQAKPLSGFGREQRRRME